ncbi:MAG: hypothetical protein Q8M95_09035, partial [Candidatus Methanoperedens sp.]|nr:hypothetical protein [Candidatus Methanoperedens sp.]
MKPSGAEEPSDSFRQNKKISILGPKEGIGSFFVAENTEIVTDINRCFELWQEFSPQKSLFDTWEFRLAFYNGYQHQPYF